MLHLRTLILHVGKKPTSPVKTKRLTAGLLRRLKLRHRASYQEKYSSLMNIYVDKLGADALVSLEKAAITVAETGPFGDILSPMTKAVEPEFGAEPLWRRQRKTGQLLAQHCRKCIS